MANKKQCPLLVAAATASDHPLSCRNECGETSCAWWLPDQGHCAVTMLARAAIDASDTLSNEIQVVNYEGR